MGFSSSITNYKQLKQVHVDQLATLAHLRAFTMLKGS